MFKCECVRLKSQAVKIQVDYFQKKIPLNDQVKGSQNQKCNTCGKI